MSRHDPLVSMRHMLDYAHAALEISQPKTRADLDTDMVFRLALTRAVEVIGEAARRVPRETRIQHPMVKWQAISGMRDRLIHGYDTVNHDLLWDVVTEDLPPLIAQLETILGPDAGEASTPD